MNNVKFTASFSEKDWRELRLVTSRDGPMLEGLSSAKLDPSLIVSAPVTLCSTITARGCCGSSRMSTCFKTNAVNIVSSSVSRNIIESHDMTRVASKCVLPLTTTLAVTVNISVDDLDSNNFLGKSERSKWGRLRFALRVVLRIYLKISFLHSYFSCSR